MSKYREDDPRDASLETRLTIPKTWLKESFEAWNALSMLMSGFIMISRNRYLAWPSLLLAINGVINQHPLRTKDGAVNTGPMMAFGAFVASYLPFFLV